MKTENYVLSATRIAFVGGEGPAAAFLGGCEGQIVQVEKDVDGESERIYIRLDQPVSYLRGVLQELVVIPRHSRFGSTALRRTLISVYVFPSLGRSAQNVALDQMIALMDIRRVGNVAG